MTERASPTDREPTEAQRHNDLQANPVMDALKITELLGGTRKGNHGVVPCSALDPGPDLDAWHLSISDFESGIWFNFDREGPGPGPSVYSGPWFDTSEAPESFRDLKLPDIEELKTMLSDWITGVREAEQYYEEERRRSEQALAIWNEVQPIQGTPAEAYLHVMGVPNWLSPPDSLRYHPHCWHPEGAPKPAMVALLTDDLHRVFPERALRAEDVPSFPKVHITYLPQGDSNAE